MFFSCCSSPDSSLGQPDVSKQLFKSRIITKRIHNRIDTEEGEIIVAIFNGFFQPDECLLLVSQEHRIFRQGIRGNIPVLERVQVPLKLPLDKTFPSRPGVGVSKLLRDIWVLDSPEDKSHSLVIQPFL